jgi:hypothetical protein
VVGNESHIGPALQFKRGIQHEKRFTNRPSQALAFAVDAQKRDNLACQVRFKNTHGRQLHALTVDDFVSESLFANDSALCSSDDAAVVIVHYSMISMALYQGGDSRTYRSFRLLASFATNAACSAEASP